ncbi:hypothetical protein C8Q78DRAFT_961166 [Trametes maxima]|nr:hypothetical protein C8Q78DRAFT_961166 [Trametes maxima]
MCVRCVCVDVFCVLTRLRTPYILADAQERVVAVLAGRPVDASWDAVVREANQAMEATAKKCCFQEQHLNHRRGFFPALATGFSYGGGQKMPGNFCNTPPNAAALDELCQNRAIKRIAGFGCTAYSLYAPKVHRSTCASLKKLCKEHPTLRFNFPNSMFPAATFNFGPDAVCIEHVDCMNDACNWCHIAALGNFDADHGGHFVLFDFKLVVRFPPGSSILIPSSIVRHANMSIRPGESQMSMTQYCAGGLVRWVETGFRTLDNFCSQDPKGYKAYHSRLKSRVMERISLFSTLESLHSDAAAPMPS